MTAILAVILWTNLTRKLLELSKWLLIAPRKTVVRLLKLQIFKRSLIEITKAAVCIVAVCLQKALGTPRAFSFAELKWIYTCLACCGES